MLKRYDPNSDPSYHAAIKYVKQHGDQMRFNTPAERKDYEAKVKSNPGNVMGIPPFLPAIPMQSSFSDLRGSVECKVEGCGGCCIAADNYVCPRCGEQN